MGVWRGNRRLLSVQSDGIQDEKIKMVSHSARVFGVSYILKLNSIRSKIKGYWRSIVSAKTLESKVHHNSKDPNHLVCRRRLIWAVIDDIGPLEYFFIKLITEMSDGHIGQTEMMSGLYCSNKILIIVNTTIYITLLLYLILDKQPAGW